MERPNGKKQPVERRVTAEMVYLYDRWKNGQQPEQYSALPEMARRMYEEDAALLVNLGRQGTILDTYEKYDVRSDLSRSCEALATELLTLHGGYSNGMQEDFEVVSLPQEVLAKVRSLHAGGLLAEDGEQLAIPSGPDGESTLDIRKHDATLTGVYLRVSKYTADRKYAVTSESGVEPQYPRDYLVYPSDEVAYRYLMEISFEYYHPAARAIQETVGLHVNERGELSVDRDMYVSGFGAAASEGMFAKGFDNITQQDVAALADIIAEIVGDTPTPTRDHDNYDYVKDYIRTVPNGLTRVYLREWLDNTSQPYVWRQLAASTSDGSTLRESLVNATDADAHNAVATLVDYDRQVHNERAQAARLEGVNTALWRDHAQR